MALHKGVESHANFSLLADIPGWQRVRLCGQTVAACGLPPPLLWIHYERMFLSPCSQRCRFPQSPLTDTGRVGHVESGPCP